MLRESLLQHASSNFLIGSQVSHLMSLRHCCSIFVLETEICFGYIVLVSSCLILLLTARRRRAVLAGGSVFLNRTAIYG